VRASVAGGHDPVLHGLGVTGKLVSGYSLLPPPTPPTSSLIVRRAGAAVTGRECPLIILFNATCYLISCQICSDARNMGIPRYNRSRYDSIRYTQYHLRYHTDPIIVRSLLCTRLKSGSIKTEPEPRFLSKNRPKPSANPKMETVTALPKSKLYTFL